MPLLANTRMVYSLRQSRPLTVNENGAEPSVVAVPVMPSGVVIAV
jgi:hypothetical protein